MIQRQFSKIVAISAVQLVRCPTAWSNRFMRRDLIPRGTTATAIVEVLPAAVPAVER